MRGGVGGTVELRKVCCHGFFGVSLRKLLLWPGQFSVSVIHNLLLGKTFRTVNLIHKVFLGFLRVFHTNHVPSHGGGLVKSRLLLITVFSRGFLGKSSLSACMFFLPAVSLYAGG